MADTTTAGLVKSITSSTVVSSVGIVNEVPAGRNREAREAVDQLARPARLVRFVPAAEVGGRNCSETARRAQSGSPASRNASRFEYSERDVVRALALGTIERPGDVRCWGLDRKTSRSEYFAF
jgi:hypothetical protein